MNQTNKTSSFLRAINKYAQEQSEAIRLEAEEFKQQEIEKATQEGIKDAYNLIQKEVSVRKAQIVSDVAIREQKSKEQLFIKRNEIVDSVFADAMSKLKDFAKSDEYEKLLSNSAKKISEYFAGAKCVVYIKSDDSKYADLISSFTPECSIKIDESIVIGGIKGYSEELSILADDTLDSKLEEQKEWFAQNCGLKVV